MCFFCKSYGIRCDIVMINECTVNLSEGASARARVCMYVGVNV